jgi:hypothetical protein
MPVILKNNVDSVLAQAINASETAMVVATGEGTKFPALAAGEYFYATLVSAQGTREIVKVTGKSGDTLAIQRGQEGTTANGFSTGSRVEMRVTAASITDLVDEHDQASEISIADAGGYYTSDNVEGALQEAAVYNQGGSGAVTRTVRSRLRDFVSVKDFGAVGDGVTDDTAAINAAISYVLTTPTSEFRGRTVYFPAGLYAVTEIDLSNTVANFNRSIRLLGEGRYASRIIPFAPGYVMLNMLGRNVAQIESLHFDSDPATSGNSNIPQCAIFMARSTTSGNCNNNKFRDVWITGNYSVASVTCNGSESSTWFGGRIENNYAPANHRCLWTGSGTAIGGLQGVTVVNGGTVSNTNNPNTDNRMFGVEFYAPFNNATMIRLSTSFGWLFDGCTLVLGNTNNSKFVLYDTPTGGRINGPAQWIGCHFEGFGSNNVVHYFDIPSAGETTMDSFQSYAGTIVVNDGTAWVDFDRTDINKKLTLFGSSLQRTNLPPGVSTLPAYVNTLNRSVFEQQKSNLTVFDFLLRSEVIVDTLNGNDTAALAYPYEILLDALPTSGQWMKGTTITKTNPVVGQPVGWKVTVSGTAGTLNGGATTVAADAVATHIVQLSSATDLFVGCKLSIGGTIRYVRSISGTTVYLNSTVTALTGSAVAFSAPTFVALPNL